MSTTNPTLTLASDILKSENRILKIQLDYYRKESVILAQRLKQAEEVINLLTKGKTTPTITDDHFTYFIYKIANGEIIISKKPKLTNNEL